MARSCSATRAVSSSFSVRVRSREAVTSASCRCNPDCEVFRAATSASKDSRAALNRWVSVFMRPMARSCPATRAERSSTCAFNPSRLRASAAKSSSSSALASVRTAFRCNRESLTPVSSRALSSRSRMRAFLRASSAVSSSTVSSVRSLSAVRAARLLWRRSTCSRPSRTVSSSCRLTRASDAVRPRICRRASASSCSLRSSVPSDRASSLTSPSTFARRAVTSWSRCRSSSLRLALSAAAWSLSPAGFPFSSTEPHEARDSDSAMRKQGVLK